MTNLQNPIQKFLDKQKDQETILKAKERFSYKPYHIENKDLFQLAKFGRLFLHTFSILTGLTFIVLLLNEAIHFLPVAIGLATILLVLWEICKSLLLTKNFVKFYATGKYNIVYALMGISFLAGSVFCSIKGAEQFYSMKDTSINDLQSFHSASVDSIKHAYLIKTKAIQEEIEKINNNKPTRWGGLLSASENKQILNYQEQIEQLQEEKESELQSLSIVHDGTLKQTTSKTAFNINAFAAITAINEALILLICWFMVYYDYRAAKYSETVYSEPIEFTLPTLQRLLQLAATTPTTKEQLLDFTASNTQNTIGFHSANATTKNAKELRGNSENASATATTLLMNDIANGIRDFRYLMNKHRVNVNTLKQAIDNYEKGRAEK